MEGSGGVFGTRFVCWVVAVSVSFWANSALDYERVRLVDVDGEFVFGSAICEPYVNVNVRGFVSADGVEFGTPDWSALACQG